MNTMNLELRASQDVWAATLKGAGIEFQRSKYFAEYCLIGHKTTELEQAAGLLEQAAEEVADGLHDDIQSALESLVCERKPTVEYCTNDEWLRVYGNYVDDTDEHGVDIVRWETDKSNMASAFADDVVEVEFVGARRDRITCHGWNGARFVHRSAGGGYGTYCLLTKEGEKIFSGQ